MASGMGRLALLGSAALFVMALAGRLVRYNISPSDRRFFSGLPSTLCGALAMSFFLVCLKYGPQADAFTDPRLLGGLDIGRLALQTYPLYLVVMAVLMLSPLRLPKVTRRERAFWNWFQIINLVGGYALGAFRWLPEYLFALGLGYAVVGLVVGALHHDESVQAEAATR